MPTTTLPRPSQKLSHQTTRGRLPFAHPLVLPVILTTMPPTKITVTTKLRVGPVLGLGKKVDLQST
jgi:hypothetical protein